MLKKSQDRKSYKSDLTDAQWAIVEPMIPPAQSNQRRGHPRTVDMREVLHTLLSLHRSGCQWDMLPHDGLPKSTVYDSFSPWRDDGTWAKRGQGWREQTRSAAGHAPTPRAACLESQSVKTTESGGPERGDDGGKKMQGRQRPLLVDTLGLLLAVVMTSAALADGVVASTRLGHVLPAAFPRLVTICADQKSHHHTLDAWMAEQRPAWHLESTRRPEGPTGFTPLATRWVVERTNAWHGRYRSNSKDEERHGESRTAMIQMSHRHLMLHRLAPGHRPAFHYRKETA